MLPLLLAYESIPRHSQRNVGEVLFSLPLSLFGRWSHAARVFILVALALGAVLGLFRSGLGREGPGLLPRLMRILLEGAVAALLLGPTLLLLLGLFDAHPDAAGLGFARRVVAPPLERAAFLAGGAAWEEIVFRIGVQSAIFLLASHLLRFFTEFPRLARAGADGLAIAASATVFAASHLGVFTQVLGPGGEPFRAGVFTWRLLAGILLGTLFRWRGPGVAAWAHALFDLFLSIGAGPDVFL
jgi:CAAX prenyl protease-like protein